MSRIGSFLSKQPVYLTLAGIGLFVLGGVTTELVVRQTTQLNVMETPGVGPPAGIESLPPQPSADPALANKEVSIKQLTGSPTKYHGIPIKLRGKIVQLSGQDGQFLRDGEGYTIKLDFKDYKGNLANTTEIVVISGTPEFDPRSQDDPLVMRVEDIQKS